MKLQNHFGVPRTTLNNWLKDQDKILRAVDQTPAIQQPEEAYVHSVAQRY